MGKKSRNKRLKKFHRKPEEMLRFDNLYMARFGEKLLLRNERNPEQHQNFLQAAAEHYPKTVEKINGLVKNIVDIIKRFDPLNILLRAYWDLLASCLGKTAESEFSIEDNMALRTLEYIQSVLASVPPVPESNGQEIDENTWANLTNLISDLYIAVTGEYHFCKSSVSQLNDPSYDRELDGFYIKAQMYWCVIRGDRYAIHDIPHLERLISPHDAVFQELFQISTEDFIKEISKIQYSVTRGVGEAIEELHQSHAEFVSVLDEIGNPDLAMQEFLNRFGQEKMQSIAQRAFRVDCFKIDQVTNLPQSLLRELAWGLGEDSEFFAPGDFAGWPFRILPIHKRPFLLIDRNYYCFDYVNFSDRLYRILQKLVLRLKPLYQTTWKDIQTEITEELPFELIGKILPNSTIYKPIFYQFPATHSANSNWKECDGILIYDDHLFIIEVKAGAFTYTSPTDDFSAYMASVKNLLLAPWKQAKRFQDYLLSSPEVPIYSYDGGDYKQITTLKAEQFRYITPCTITLDNITELASRVETLKPLGLDTVNAPIWSISIDDLRIYSDLFKSPLRFLHYIEQRQKAYLSPRYIANDELDHLGMYLKHNQYATYAEEFGGNAPPSFHGYSEEIDRYYNKLSIEPEEAELPQQEMPPTLDKIIHLLSEQRKPHHSKVSSYLLNLSGTGREEVSEAIDFILRKQLERQSYIKFSTVGPVKMTVGSRIVELMPPKSQLKDFALAEILGNSEDERLLLELEYDSNLQLVNVDWEFLTLHDIPDERIPELLEVFKGEQYKRIKTTLQKVKKVGPNEKCPCGSDKKYKKCHGR